jgi:putative peptide zinc metalloprotease protein
VDFAAETYSLRTTKGLATMSKLPQTQPASIAMNQPTVQDELAAKKEKIIALLSPLSIGLRRDLEVSRQVANGDIQYVIRDPLTFNSCALAQEDYQVFLHLEHMQSVRQAYENLTARGIISADQRDEFFQFVVDLQRHNLILLPIVDGKVLYERFAERRKKEKASLPMRLISFQLPLFNPDRFLELTKRFAWPLFQSWFLVAWLFMVGLATYMVSARWSDFSSATASLLALQSLPLLIIILCILKAWHELGHAYACKIFGGTVPEIGLFFIVGTPCAYVDASSAWGFRDRWQRIAVNLAGMYFESLIAIIAVFVWSLTPPGLINSIAHYTIVISTVVTIMFNANPLLKFDGYYVLCDFLNIPNLKRLATASMQHCLKRIFLGIEAPGIGVTWWSDRLFTLFGAASDIYRVTVTLGIFAFLSLQIPTVGLLLGLFYIFAGLIPTIDRIVRYLLFQPETRGSRRRAVLLIGGSAAALTLIIVMPVWSAISFTGVVGRENETFIRSPEPGFVTTVGFKPSQEVQPGDVLFELTNEELLTRRAAAKVEVSKLKSQLLQSLQTAPTEFGLLKQRLHQAELDLRDVESAIERLTIRAPKDGVLAEWQKNDFEGRFFQSGEPLIKLESGKWVVRAFATDEEISDSQVAVGDAVEFEVIGQPGKRLHGSVIGVAKSSQTKIDETVLTQLGGGDIGIDPYSQKASEAYFSITMQLDSNPESTMRSGIRVQAMVPNRRWSLGRSLARKVWQFYHRYLLG